MASSLSCQHSKRSRAGELKVSKKNGSSHHSRACVRPERCGLLQPAARRRQSVAKGSCDLEGGDGVWGVRDLMRPGFQQPWLSSSFIMHGFRRKTQQPLYMTTVMGELGTAGLQLTEKRAVSVSLSVRWGGGSSLSWEEALSCCCFLQHPTQRLPALSPSLGTSEPQFL